MPVAQCGVKVQREAHTCPIEIQTRCATTIRSAMFNVATMLRTACGCSLKSTTALSVIRHQQVLPTTNHVGISRCRLGTLIVLHRSLPKSLAFRCLAHSVATHGPFLPRCLNSNLNLAATDCHTPIADPADAGVDAAAAAAASAGAAPCCTCTDTTACSCSSFGAAAAAATSC